MANRPIIDVELNDAAFQRFIEQFNAYTDELKKQPEAWAALNASMGGAGKALKEGALEGTEALALAAAQASLISKAVTDATKGQREFNVAVKESDRGLAALARTAANSARGVGRAFSGAVSGSIAEIGSGLIGAASSAAKVLGPVGMAVGEITAALGAITIGSGVALKALADTAVGRQRSAFGMGISPGREASFDIYGQQFLGSGALHAAANAQLSVGNAGNLALLGIDWKTAKNKPADRLAFSMLYAATKAAQNPRYANLGLEDMPEVRAYEALGGQASDVRNALALGLPALNAAHAETERNVGRLEISRKSVSASAAFKKAVEAAGVQAQSAAINASTPVQSFAAAQVNDLAAAASNAAAALWSIHPKSAADRESEKRFGTGVYSRPAEQVGEKMRRRALQVIHNAKITIDKSLHAALNTPAAAAVIAVAKKFGIDPALALAGAFNESRLNPNSYVRDYYGDGSYAGMSAGLYQLNDHGEGAGMTLAQLLDPTKNATVALAEFARIKKLHPDWSPGEVAFAAERPAARGPHGEDLKTPYIARVNAYYAQIRAERSSRSKVDVTVRNSTAARVSVSVNAASQ